MATWSITITDNQGGTWTPHIHGPPGTVYPKEIPTANGVPELQFAVLPLSGSDSWFDTKFEQADISVSKDGTTQPYSTLIGVESQHSSGEVVLKADGGDELQERVDVSFGAIPTHDAAEQVVTGNTSYGVDIPTPATTRTDNVTILDRTTNGSLTTSDFEKIPEDSPAHINGSGYLTAHQTVWPDTGTSALSDKGDGFDVSFTTNYHVPADRIGAAIYTDVSNNHVGVELAVDGEVIGEIQPGEDFSNAPVWVRYSGGDSVLAPGSHTLSVEVTKTEDSAGNPTSGLTPDEVAVFDAKWKSDYDWDLEDTSPSTTPNLYPDRTNVFVQEPFVTRAVRGLNSANVTWTSGGGSFLFRNEEGDIYSGSDPVDFGDYGPVADVIVQLTTYNQGQDVNELQAFELQADLETMPLVVNERFEGTVAEVLTQIADSLRGDFVWTFDTDGSGNGIVRFVRTGARTTTDNNVEGYQIQKRTDRQLDEVKVLGGSVGTSEQVRVDHDTAVSLTKDRLDEDSETVRAPGFDQPLSRGDHYSINYSDGEITANSDAGEKEAVDDDELITVSYQFQPTATVTVSSPPVDKRTKVTPELPLRSDRACRLAGEQILNTLETPQYEASLQLRGDTTYSVVEQFDAGRLPVSNLDTVNIEATDTGALVRLEASQTPSQIIGDVAERITNVAKYVQ